MLTQILFVHPDRPESDRIASAAEVILRGGLVAFPTETVYGLGANVYDRAAVGKIFAAKGRPAEDPLIVHLANAADLPRVTVDLPEVVGRLSAAFWPGPLTLVLPRHPHIHPVVSAGLDTVAVRVPAHPVARALLSASNVPIVAPSANLFGHSSPTTAQHVLDDLDGRIDMILDGGPTHVGVESTVLDVTGDLPVILRPGGVTLEALQALLGQVALHAGTAENAGGAQVSPGLLGKHYAPRAQLVLLQIDRQEELLLAIRQAASQGLAQGKRVGLLLADEDCAALADLPARIAAAGPLRDLAEVARNLYKSIRKLDEESVDLIVARDFGEAGIGRAIRDRLSRAASRIITQAEPSA